MAGANEFRIIVATDGSNDARAAVTTAGHFPWPASTRVRVVVARRNRAEYRRSILLTALDRSAEIAADHARRALARRWPDVDVVIVDKAPVRAVLAEAERFRADAIIVGWRGHGAVRRVLMGSVSRGVVRGAQCAVLVVRRPQRVRRIVVGLDRSPDASRALAFVERLAPPDGARVTLATAVTLTPVPSRRIALGAGALVREVRHEDHTGSDGVERTQSRSGQAQATGVGYQDCAHDRRTAPRSPGYRDRRACESAGCWRERNGSPAPSAPGQRRRGRSQPFSGSRPRRALTDRAVVSVGGPTIADSV